MTLKGHEQTNRLTQVLTHLRAHVRTYVLAHVPTYSLTWMTPKGPCRVVALLTYLLAHIPTARG